MSIGRRSVALRGRPAPWARVLARLLPGVAVALVVGILGMHALGSTHSMAGDAGPGMPGMPGTVGMTAMTGTSGMADAGSGPSAEPPVAVPSPGGGGHDLGDMVMLCVAMLTSAGALLLTILALRRVPRRWLRLSSGLCAQARVGRVEVAATGPPPVWDFSVIRC